MAVIEAIETVYLEADASSVTFSSIPSTYEHLQLRTNVKNSKPSNNYDPLSIQFNGDSANNYAFHRMYGFSTSNGADGSASTSSILAYAVATLGGSDRAEYGGACFDVLDYRNSNKYTTVACTGGGSTSLVGLASGVWLSTAAVTSITVASISSRTLLRGSEFTLYGLNSS